MINFFRKRAHTDRKLDASRVEEAACRQIMLRVPVETRRRDRGVRQPIERDVVKNRDIGAMGESVRVLIGGPQIAYVLGFGAICAVLQIFLAYKRYVVVLKWLTLALFAYVATLLFVKIDWRALLIGLFVPRLETGVDYLTAIVAIFGTTISPYLFFWQSSQEVEDTKTTPKRKPLKRAPEQASDAHDRIQFDTLLGMGFSNLIALATMVTAVATLHAAGDKNVQNAADAARALRPLAGPFAEALFALGIVGTGLLAVPVLAGSAAYGVGEALSLADRT